MIREILFYQTAEGRKPCEEWLENLRDVRARVRIKARLDRVLNGNFGDIQLVGTGVWEIRFHFGPGYRIYFGLNGDILVILLCGGDKSTQEGDIGRACTYWADYLRRK